MLRKHQPETKADHLAIFNMCMARHADAHQYAASRMDDPQLAHCYQQEATYWYRQADYHRECYKTAPTERGGWRPY